MLGQVRFSYVKLGQVFNTSMLLTFPMIFRSSMDLCCHRVQQISDPNLLVTKQSNLVYFFPWNYISNVFLMVTLDDRFQRTRGPANMRLTSINSVHLRLSKRASLIEIGCSPHTELFPKLYQKSIVFQNTQTDNHNHSMDYCSSLKLNDVIFIHNILAPHECEI